MRYNLSNFKCTDPSPETSPTSRHSHPEGVQKHHRQSLPWVVRCHSQVDPVGGPRRRAGHSLRAAGSQQELRTVLLASAAVHKLAAVRTEAGRTEAGRAAAGAGHTAAGAGRTAAGADRTVADHTAVGHTVAGSAAAEAGHIHPAQWTWQGRCEGWCVALHPQKL